MFLLSDDQQGHIWNNIEDQKNYFEESEERVNYHIKGFSGQGKPYVLSTVYQIGEECTYGDPENQQGSVYDCTPHKDCGECLSVQDVPSFYSLIESALKLELYSLCILKIKIYFYDKAGSYRKCLVNGNIVVLVAHNITVFVT